MTSLNAQQCASSTHPRETQAIPAHLSHQATERVTASSRAPNASVNGGSGLRGYAIAEGPHFMGALLLVLRSQAWSAQPIGCARGG